MPVAGAVRREDLCRDGVRLRPLALSQRRRRDERRALENDAQRHLAAVRRDSKTERESLLLFSRGENEIGWDEGGKTVGRRRGQGERQNVITKASQNLFGSWYCLICIFPAKNQKRKTKPTHMLFVLVLVIK